MDGLKIKRVSKAINRVKIVDNLTASFLPGKITALIGPNGAGKTTLFHLITGELHLDSGEIVYCGKNLSALSPFKIARYGIGRLFQDIRIFEYLTIYENVASSCYHYKSQTPWFPFVKFRKWNHINKEIIERVNKYLNLTGLLDFKDCLASSLSYGQQKLLAIARILAGGFSVLLLDEPTAGLNTIMIKKVLNILKCILIEDPLKTIIIVEHDMAVVKQIADWVYFMNEGQIAFFGRTDHVLGNKKVREIYLGL